MSELRDLIEKTAKAIEGEMIDLVDHSEYDDDNRQTGYVAPQSRDYFDTLQDTLAYLHDLAGMVRERGEGSAAAPPVLDEASPPPPLPDPDDIYWSF